MFKNIFRGVLAVILLGLYAYTVIIAILVTTCLSQGAGCTSYSKDSFTSGLTFTMAAVGGLVSAMVVAELTNTDSGQLPSGITVNPNPTAGAKPNLTTITIVYLLVWVILGLLAFVIGFLLHPGVLQPLTDLGQAWLGLALAAGYAYFGIRPK